MDLLKQYKEVTFEEALKTWDNTSKKVVCVYRQTLKEFPKDAQYRSEFVVHAGLILEGKWYVEK